MMRKVKGIGMNFWKLVFYYAKHMELISYLHSLYKNSKVPFLTMNILY